MSELTKAATDRHQCLDGDFRTPALRELCDVCNRIGSVAKAATDEQIREWRFAASSDSDARVWADRHMRALILRIDELNQKLDDCLLSEPQGDTDGLRMRGYQTSEKRNWTRIDHWHNRTRELESVIAEQSAILGPKLECCGRYAVEHRESSPLAMERPHATVWCPDGRKSGSVWDYRAWLDERSKR